MRIVVMGAVQAAAQFIGSAWRGAWAILGLVSGALAAAIVAPPGPRRLAWLVLAILWAVGARGALYRMAMGRGRVGPGGLQWGLIEWRLLAVTLLAAIFIGILVLLLFVIILCAAYAAASAGHGFNPDEVATWAAAVDSRGRWMVSLIAMAGAVGLGWVSIRIALADAVTVAKGRVHVLAAWPLTRTLTYPILFAGALVAVGPMLIILALTRIAILALPASGGVADWALAVGAALAICGLWLPLNVGLMSYFHRRIDDVSILPGP